jgi:hypothetical protein
VRAFLAAVVVLSVACGAVTSPLVGAEAALPTCQEAVTDAADAHAGCVAAAALVTCSVGEVCISNDPTRCGATAGCRNECTGSEYAVACDDRPQHTATPPPGCQPMEVAASGTQYYCCPCTP